MLYRLIGNQSGCYQLLLLSVWLLPTTVWSLPWRSQIATTGNYQQKTSMKLGKKPQRFIKENFCSILEYILSDHFTIRSIKMKIHTWPNSVSTYLTPMNQLLHSQTGMKMYVQELLLSFIISNLPKIRIPYIQKSINVQRHIDFVKSTTSMTSRLLTFSSFKIHSFHKNLKRND